MNSTHGHGVRGMIRYACAAAVAACLLAGPAAAPAQPAAKARPFAAAAQNRPTPVAAQTPPASARTPSAQSKPAAAAARQAAVKLPPELARVLTDYEKAWAARDPAALARLFTEDGWVLSSGSPPVQGRPSIERHYKGQGGALSLRPFAFATNGDLAHILGGYGPSPQAEEDGKFTLTLRKVGPRWLINSDMDNPNRRPR
jgi:ketosteroid isomerase-like protein